MSFLPTELLPAEERLRLDVREFLAETIPSGHQPGLGILAPHDPEFSRRLAARGWVGMNIPKEYGGAGATEVDRYLVAEELLAAGAHTGAHWVAERQTAPTLLRYGTEEQKDSFLPRIAAGELYFSLGMSEPDAGSDLAAVRTSAKKVAGGWSLTGTKVWTSGAHVNDYFVVLCRTGTGGDRHSGLSQLIVDLRSPGISVSPIPFIDGSRHFNEVALEDVFVADSRVLGTVGDGWAQVVGELAFERSGPDRYLTMLATFTAYVNQLGKTVYPAQKSGVGRMYAKLWAIRLLGLSVARQLDRGAVPSVEAALVKDIGTTFEQEMVETLRCITDREIDPQSSAVFDRLMAEAILTGPSFTIRGGTTEILRSVAAKGLGRNK